MTGAALGILTDPFWWAVAGVAIAFMLGLGCIAFDYFARPGAEW